MLVLILAVAALSAAMYATVSEIIAGTPWHLTGAGPTLILAMAVIVLASERDGRP